MIRYHACGYDGLGSCGIGGDTGDFVLAADAQHEIDARDEKIYDLKALLRRAADNIGSWYPVDGAEARLVADIEKALA